MSELIEYLKKVVPEYWKEKEKPYLISQIGSEYKKEKIKEMTGGISILKWIENNEDDLQVKIVVHPEQIQKIGLIPNTETYNYDVQVAIDITEKNDRELTLAFLDMIKRRCNTQELDQIYIPTKVLVKLLFRV